MLEGVRALTWVLSLALAACSFASDYKIIADDPIEPADRAALEREMDRGIAAWRRHFGAIDHPPVVRVGGGAMRAGYNAEKDEIGFPASGAVIARGVRSSDIVLHELFHALASQFPEARAAASGDDDQRAIHEALADHFAHTLNPDAHFGENYYTDQPHVRSYHSDFCYELAQGAHARGNALVSRLIDAGYTLDDVAVFLKSRPFTRDALLAIRSASTPCLAATGAPQVDVEAKGYPASMLQKFVLEPGRPLELSFHPDAAFARELGPLDVSWHPPELDGIEATQVGPTVWRLDGRAGARPRKAVVRLNAGGRVVGFIPFYFRVR